MTMDRSRLIDEARAVLQDYHGDREADDVTLIDAVDLLATLAGLTYLVDDNGAVTLEDPRAASGRRDANIEFLPGDGGDARPCLVVNKVQVYSYIHDETGRLQVSIDTDDADGLVPIDIAVNGTDVVSLPGSTAAMAPARGRAYSAAAVVGDDHAHALAIARSDDENAARSDWSEETWARYLKYARASRAHLTRTITELAELEALPAGSLIKLPDGEIGMVMVARDKRHVIGYPGTLPTNELPEVINGAYGDPIIVVWDSGRAA